MIPSLGRFAGEDDLAADTSAPSAVGPTRDRIVAVLTQLRGLRFCPELPGLCYAFLHVLPEGDCFATLEALIGGKHKDDYFAKSPEDEMRFAAAFSHLLAERDRELWQFVERLGSRELTRRVFLVWFRDFFMGWLPPEDAICVVDCFLCEGRKVLMRFGLTLLQLLFPAVRHVRTVDEFIGYSKGLLAAARRRAEEERAAGRAAAQAEEEAASRRTIRRIASGKERGSASFDYSFARLRGVAFSHRGFSRQWISAAKDRPTTTTMSSALAAARTAAAAAASAAAAGLQLMGSLGGVQVPPGSPAAAAAAGPGSPGGASSALQPLGDEREGGVTRGWHVPNISGRRSALLPLPPTTAETSAELAAEHPNASVAEAARRGLVLDAPRGGWAHSADEHGAVDAGPALGLPCQPQFCALASFPLAALVSYLPPRVRDLDWRNLYTTATHGWGLSTLHRYTRGIGPVLVVVEARLPRPVGQRRAGSGAAAEPRHMAGPFTFGFYSSCGITPPRLGAKSLQEWKGNHDDFLFALSPVPAVLPANPREQAATGILPRHGVQARPKGFGAPRPRATDRPAGAEAEAGAEAAALEPACRPVQFTQRLQTDTFIMSADDFLAVGGSRYDSGVALRIGADMLSMSISRALLHDLRTLAAAEEGPEAEKALRVREDEEDEADELAAARGESREQTATEVLARGRAGAIQRSALEKDMEIVGLEVFGFCGRNRALEYVPVESDLAANTQRLLEQLEVKERREAVANGQVREQRAAAVAAAASTRAAVAVAAAAGGGGGHPGVGGVSGCLASDGSPVQIADAGGADMPSCCGERG